MRCFARSARLARRLARTVASIAASMAVSSAIIGAASVAPCWAQATRCDHYLGNFHVLPGDLLRVAPPDCAYDDDIVGWEGVNLPPGMVLEPVEGSLSWVPDVWQGGLYTGVEIVSTNVRGGSAVWWFDVDVAATAAPSLGAGAAAELRWTVRAIAAPGGGVRFICESDVERVARGVVRDVRGRVAARLMPHPVPRGRSVWEWDAREVAAGAYWCTFTTRDGASAPPSRVVLR